MTFEEFFIKKKIDLEALKKENTPLYNEFKAHFEQMNEKSFDHSKKYWFNNLRLKYPLKEEKETPKPAEGKQNLQGDASPKASGGYKPLFKKKQDTSNS